MDAPDFSEFQLWPHGNKYEDFNVGATFEHHWGRTINAGDASLFSSVALRYCPLYINAEYAREQGHKDVVVDPLLVLATVIGLSVEDLSEAGGPFLGVNKVVFHETVYPGDTITASSLVLDKRESASRPDSGIVTWQTTAHNQRGNVVVQYERTNIILKRDN